MRRLLSPWGLAALALATFLSTPSASAQIIEADFTESLDLPANGSLGPRVLQNLNVALPSAGPHLTVAHEISNPSSWEGVMNVSFDATTNILSLTGTDFAAYQVITVTLSDLAFALPGLQITGITPISIGNAVTPFQGPAPTVETTFSASAFSVEYSIPLVPGDAFVTNIQETDTFQVTVGPLAVGAPEPGTLALLGVGLGMAGLVARRRAR